MNIDNMESEKDRTPGVFPKANERQVILPNYIPCRHHFVCIKCHSVNTFDDYAGMMQLLNTKEFHTASSQVFNYGYCDDCQPQNVSCP